jgi:hypothetical protein
MLQSVEARGVSHERLDLAERVLTCALHLSGLERGAIALWMPEVRGKARYRIACSRGFEPEVMPMVVRLLAKTARRPGAVGMRGLRYAYTSGGRRAYLGGGGLFPLVASGRVIGAIVLERPGRSAPLGCFEARQVVEFVSSGARLLFDSLRDSGECPPQGLRRRAC